MRVNRAQGPTRLRLAALESGRHEIPSVSVAISQPAGAASVWSLRIEARFTAQGVTREIGRIETVPPISASPVSKIAAVASAPGAVDWWVEVEWIRNNRTQNTEGLIDGYIDIDLSASLDQTMPGVTVFDGAALLQRGRYAYLAGTLPAGATSIAVPAGWLVQTVSAWQVGAGGTVALAGGAAIPIPPSGGMQLGPQGSILGPTTVDFAAIPVGGGGYLIEGTQ